ncbi:MAG: hypothetical protein M0C28_16255 [Candidatus Moduliflexus flocculans]|nr:hypothetical protein [Candidatus Moduliflexus flocculans]
MAQRYADIGSSVMGRLVELRVKEGEAGEGRPDRRADRRRPGGRERDAPPARRVKGSEADLRATADVLQARAVRPRRGQGARRRRRSSICSGRATCARTASCPRRTSTAPRPPPTPRQPRSGSAEAGLRRLQQVREAADRRVAETRADSTRVADILAKTDIARAASPAVCAACRSRKARWWSWASRASSARTLMTDFRPLRHRRRGEGRGGGCPADRARPDGNRHARGHPRCRPSRGAWWKSAPAPFRWRGPVPRRASSA